MTKIEQIRKPIYNYLEQYHSLARESLKSEDAYLNQLCDYVLSNQGKGLRPMLAILTAALHGTPDNKTYSSAFLLEIVHTASLIHDDVVDESYMRRGRPSINALWNSQTAVLVGDYLFSRALCHSLDNGLTEQASMVCKVIYSASEGELAQSNKTQTLAMTTENYFDIIYKKTAMLFGVAASMGACSVQAQASDVAKMQSLGDNIGIAFQIQDDILDYTCDESITGKPSCCDLREKKITLPLLYVLDRANDQTRAEMIDSLSLVDSKPENIAYLQKAVIDGGGIEYATKIKNEYCDKARALINDYPDSPIKTAILLYIDLI